MQNCGDDNPEQNCIFSKVRCADAQFGVQVVLQAFLGEQVLSGGSESSIWEQLKQERLVQRYGDTTEVNKKHLWAKSPD